MQAYVYHQPRTGKRVLCTIKLAHIVNQGPMGVKRRGCHVEALPQTGPNFTGYVIFTPNDKSRKKPLTNRPFLYIMHAMGDHHLPSPFPQMLHGLAFGGGLAALPREEEFCEHIGARALALRDTARAAFVPFTRITLQTALQRFSRLEVVVHGLAFAQQFGFLCPVCLQKGGDAVASLCSPFVEGGLDDGR